MRSVSHPPTGAPMRPLSPAAESSVPAAVAPPGRTAAASTGTDAILAHEPNRVPHSAPDRPRQRRSANNCSHNSWLPDSSVVGFDSRAPCTPPCGTVSGKIVYSSAVVSAAALTHRKVERMP
eukprot:5142154-Prymnesium_polylepis.2